MVKQTNNFKEVPDTKELWIDIGNDIILSVYYDNEEQNWKESISKKDSKFKIIVDCDEGTDEAHYLHYVISAFKCLGFTEDFDDEFIFTGRTMAFGSTKQGGDYITIQTGREDEKGDYNCELIYLDKEKWLEIAQFFEYVSLLFLNRENLNGGRNSSQD